MMATREERMRYKQGIALDELAKAIMDTVSLRNIDSNFAELLQEQNIDLEVLHALQVVTARQKLDTLSKE